MNSFRSDNEFSFMIMRPDGQGSWSFRLSKAQFFIFIAASIIFIFLIIGAIYFYTQTGQNRVDYATLKEKNRYQEAQLQELNSKTEQIQHTIQNLLEKESQIQYILDEDGRISPRRRSSRQSISSRFLAQYQEFPAVNTGNIHSVISDKLAFFSKTLDSLSDGISKHHAYIMQKKDRFSATPSIWPIHGRIKSGYGYRTHPITGERRFHRGIDIPAWVGAPIRVTADGIVEYAGWSGGYGYVVVVNHAYRYRTVYAHASQLIVRRGEAVRKGQVVAQVGSTGLSTAPHLHYEVWVRKRGKRKMAHVRPNGFLSLDFFSASVENQSSYVTCSVPAMPMNHQVFPVNLQARYDWYDSGQLIGATPSCHTHNHHHASSPRHHFEH